MTIARSNARGVAAMLFATASFVICDSFLKLATATLPPFEVLFLRGIAATVCCGGLVLALGQGRFIGQTFNRIVVLRGSLEAAATLCYIIALANMPIADAVAIIQTAPLILILLLAVIWREKVGWLRIALVLGGFAGALLVAQPDTSGLSPAALLAFICAFGVAWRDLLSRGIPAAIPALVVTFSTVLNLTIVSGVLTFATEDVVMPDATIALYMLGAGIFVTLGHFGIFMAYRLGAASAVAPFFYSFAVWAVLAGLIVFRELPNPLALLGIGAIVASGLGVVLLDRRKTRALAADTPA
jgi:drug/metabolite transporter (DMT)-like permease